MVTPWPPPTNLGSDDNANGDAPAADGLTTHLCGMRSLIYACNGEVEELVKFLVHVRSLLEIMMEIKQ